MEEPGLYCVSLLFLPVCLVVWDHNAGMEMDRLQKPIWHSAMVTEAERRENIQRNWVGQ